MSPLLKWKRYRSHIALFCFATFIMASVDIPSAQTLDQKFDEYLIGAGRVLHFSGTVLVMKDNKILFTRGYGMADISASKPNTPETKYLLGSVTKQFTATAIMQLSEKKLLNLNDPIAKYLPDYPQPAADKVTIYHLLTNTSGIADYTDLPEFDEMYLNPAGSEDDETYMKPARFEEIVSMFKDLPLAFEPGSEWYYSSSNYYLLGLVIERVSGESYGGYVRKNIFEPLGMKNSGYPDGFIDHVPGLAKGYRFDSTDNLIPAPVVHSSLPFSAGGLYSTVGDMAKWDQGLRNGTLLSLESLTQMFTPFKWRYGCGWEIDTLFGYQMVSHGGSGGGFTSSFLRFVDEPFCVVVFSNNDAGHMIRIALGLAAIAYGEPYDVPTKKTPIAIDGKMLDDYVGAYEIGADRYNIVTREGDSLYLFRTGGKRIRLQAEAEDKFFYDIDNTRTLTFVRDKAGHVAEQIIHGNGRDVRAPRIEGEKAQQLLESLIPATVDPATYRAYAGDYEVAPGFVISFICRDNRFFTKATGQDEVEIFPRSETEFFLKVADGQVRFVKDSTGTVTGLIIHQGGRELSAKKVR